jgi:hypothetical protein
LLPKDRRPPVMPTATPPDQVEAVLAEAVARPTIGAQRLVDHLADRGVRLSASGVQKILRRHRLGRRAQRLAALAQLTATTTGILTSDAKQGPFGFCHFAARPGDLVALTPSMSASSKASGRSGSSPQSTPRPATRSAPWSLGTSQPATRPPSSTTWPSAWPASGPNSPGSSAIFILSGVLMSL